MHTYVRAFIGGFLCLITLQNNRARIKEYDRILRNKDLRFLTLPYILNIPQNMVASNIFLISHVCGLAGTFFNDIIRLN